MWGIKGYEPRPLTASQDLAAQHGDRLNSLVGRRLSRAWGLCFVCDSGWCSTRPIVLDFEGERLEIAAEGFDQLYVTWNEIDLNEPPDDPDQDEPDFALAWSDPGLPDLKQLMGGRVSTVRVLENDFRFQPVDGGQIEAWLLAGLEFVIGQRGFQLYNSLNELTAAFDDPDSHRWRRRELPRGE